MHLHIVSRHSLILAGLLGLAAASSAEEFIVRDGQPRARIVIAAQPTRMQKLAADELQKYVRKITGAELQVGTAPTNTLPVTIYVGQSAYTDQLGLDNTDLHHGGYRIVSGTNYLVLLGRDTDYVQAKPGAGGPEFPASRADRTRATQAWKEKHGDQWGAPFVSYFKSFHAGLGVWAIDEHGSLNAVNDFLRFLGAEWYMPGDFGEVLPHRTSIPLPDVDRTVRPEFATRNMGFYFNAPFMASADEFLWQLRLGFNPNGELGGHGIMYMLEPEAVKREHPEYFALYGDQRETLARGGKPCCSSTGLLNSALGFAGLMFDEYGREVVSLMPTDGYSALCGCPLCQGKGTPERGPRGSLSDYVWTFINDGGRAIEKSHPAKKVSCYAYGAYLLPPEKIDRLSPNVAIGICQNRAYFYESETRDTYRSIRQGWLQKVPARKFSIWEYYLFARPDRNWAGIPVYYPRLIAEDLRSLKGMVNGEGIEVSRNFSSLSNPAPDPALAVNHLNCWLTARLWWDPDQNVDALLDDYYRKFYGPAAGEMKAFIEFCEQSWPTMSQDAERTGKALNLLDLARKAAGTDTIYAQRVQLVTDYVKRPLTQLLTRLTTRRADLAYTRLGDFWGETDFKLDGRLDDQFWKHTSYCGFALFDCRTGSKPVEATRIQAVWAFGALHFAIQCQQTNSAALYTPATTNDDPAIFDGDYVALLLESPCHAYYEIAIAPNGVMLDSDRKDGNNLAWSSLAEVATQVGSNSWTAEIRIPVLDEGQVDVDPDHAGVAGSKPTPTYPWFFNCGRQCKQGLDTEISARYPTGTSSFTNTYYFGALRVRK